MHLIESKKKIVQQSTYPAGKTFSLAKGKIMALYAVKMLTFPNLLILFNMNRIKGG